jgi:hypothetical protein
MRVQRLAAIAWSVVATAAGLGFVARDVLGLPPAPVALAWTAGAAVGLWAAGARRRRAPSAETTIRHDMRV